MGWGWDYIKDLASKAEHLGGEVVHDAENAGNATVEDFEQAGKRLEDHPALAATVRPHGTNAHDIYLMFHGADVRGTGSIDTSVAGWRKVSGHHLQAGDALTSAMSKLGVAWQGKAANSAGATVTPLREAADTASQRALRAGATLEAQSSGWHDTAHKVTDAPTEPPRMSIAGTDPVSPVLSQAEAAAYTSGQQANQQALSAYGTTTGSNSQNAPQFAAPPAGPSTRSGSGVQGAGSTPGSTGTADATGQSTVDGDAPAQRHEGFPVHSGQVPAETHSSWQLQATMHQPGAGQSTARQGAMPIAGVAAGGAALIAGGGALMGGSLLGQGAGGEPSIGARLAGGGATGAKGGSSDSAGRGGTGEFGDEAEPGQARSTRGRKESDQEHQNADYLVEANPHEVFGQGRQVAPPVFGEQRAPSAGPAEDA